VRPTERPVADHPDIIWGQGFELLPVDLIEKSTVLREAEEVFRLFYGMFEGILSVKEEETVGARDFED